MKLASRDLRSVALVAGLSGLLVFDVAVGFARGFDRVDRDALVRVLAAPGIALGWGGPILLLLALPYVLFAWRKGRHVGTLQSIGGAIVLALAVGALAGVFAATPASGGGRIGGGFAHFLRSAVGGGLSTAVLLLLAVPALLLALAPLVLESGISRAAVKSATVGGPKPWYPERRLGPDGVDLPVEFKGSADVGPIRYRDDEAAARAAETPASTVSLSPPPVAGPAVKKPKPISGIRYADGGGEEGPVVATPTEAETTPAAAAVAALEDALPSGVRYAPAPVEEAPWPASDEVAPSYAMPDVSSTPAPADATAWSEEPSVAGSAAALPDVSSPLPLAAPPEIEEPAPVAPEPAVAVALSEPVVGPIPTLAFAPPAPVAPRIEAPVAPPLVASVAATPVLSVPSAPPPESKREPARPVASITAAAPAAIASASAVVAVPESAPVAALAASLSGGSQTDIPLRELTRPEKITAAAHPTAPVPALAAESIPDVVPAAETPSATSAAVSVADSSAQASAAEMPVAEKPLAASRAARTSRIAAVVDMEVTRSGDVSGAAYRKKLASTGLLDEPHEAPGATPKTSRQRSASKRPRDVQDAIRGLFSSLPLEDLPGVEEAADPTQAPVPGGLEDAEVEGANRRGTHAALFDAGVAASGRHPGSNDPLFAASVEAAIERGSASLVLLKRKLGVGYSRAATLIEALVGEGILGEMTASGSRPTLVSAADWLRRSKSPAAR